MKSRMQGFEHASLMDVVNSKRVWLIHVTANAALIIAFFYWTRIPDEHGWQFALSVLSGVVIASITLWLHAATFDYFREQTSFRQSLRHADTRLPWFLLWVLIFGGVLWLIGHAWTYDAQTGGWLRHLLPEFLRRNVSPRTMIAAVSAVIWFVFYFLWPIISLPFAAQVSCFGIRGFFSAAALRPVRTLRFWIMYAICFLFGAYIPYKLAWMTPTQSSPLNTQTWSMVFRLGLGYLLLVTGWLVLCAAITRAINNSQAEPKA
jgi:hypothetical protein